MSTSSNFNNDKRFSSNGNKNYQIERIWDRQREIARLVALGQTNAQISKQLGCTPQTVSNVRNNGIVEAIIESYREERDGKVKAIIDEIIEFAPQVIGMMKKAAVNDTIKMEEDEDGNLMAVNKTGLPGELPEKPTIDNMIRAGGKLLEIALPKTSEHNVNVTHADLDEDDISDIKRKSRERKRQMGLIEEAEFTEVSENEDNE